MKKSDFLFDLPNELIAQYPRKKGKSRLMVVRRNSGKIEHRGFSDIVDYVKPKDCFVLNNSKVIPARINAFILKVVHVLLHFICIKINLVFIFQAFDTIGSEKIYSVAVINSRERLFAFNGLLFVHPRSYRLDLF